MLIAINLVSVIIYIRSLFPTPWLLLKTPCLRVRVGSNPVSNPGRPAGESAPYLYCCGHYRVRPMYRAIIITKNDWRYISSEIVAQLVRASVSGQRHYSGTTKVRAPPFPLVFINLLLLNTMYAPLFCLFVSAQTLDWPTDIGHIKKLFLLTNNHKLKDISFFLNLWVEDK